MLEQYMFVELQKRLTRKIMFVLGNIYESSRSQALKSTKLFKLLQFNIRLSLKDQQVNKHLCYVSGNHFTNVGNNLTLHNLRINWA